LILTVSSAVRQSRNGEVTTTGAGALSSKDSSAGGGAPQHINFVCEAGVFARAGNNTYPARITKPYQFKIEWREMGSEKTREATCKY
jgi:hypothetical protein